MPGPLLSPRRPYDAWEGNGSRESGNQLPHHPALGRDQSPGRSSPRMPGCPPVTTWALSLALPGPVPPVKNAGMHAFLPALPPRPRASRQAVCRDSASL